MVMKNGQIMSLENRLLRIASVIVLIISSSVGAEEELTFAEAKVFYTLQIAKHIEWPNEDNMDEIVVGLLGVDQEVMAVIGLLGPSNIRGKTLRFDYLENEFFALDRYSIILLSEKQRTLNSQLFQRATTTLIITDGKVDKEEHLISLISTTGKITVTLNRDNLTARGFRLSIDLSDLVGTKKDLSNQLRDSDLRLKILLKQLAEKERNLVELNETLTKYFALLDSAKKTLSENETILNEKLSQLESLMTKIDVSRAEVAKKNSEIDRQNHLIEQK